MSCNYATHKEITLHAKTGVRQIEVMLKAYVDQAYEIIEQQAPGSTGCSFSGKDWTRFEIDGLVKKFGTVNVSFSTQY